MNNRIIAVKNKIRRVVEIIDANVLLIFILSTKKTLIGLSIRENINEIKIYRIGVFS
jgi:hypothetical protein|tara:strand:- start:3116 stop:3286 length:171 start_codon:yes stop_codon:yes gene_type:complete